jgi:catechol 2,3-dioxygenase-like lactoylglutathione lyase family enzyme
MSSSQESLPLTELNHVSYICGDLDKSIAFYRDILGFQEIKRPSSLRFPGQWLHGYGISIHLVKGVPDHCRSSEITSKADHVSFQCSSIEDVKRILAKKEIRFLESSIEENNILVHQVFFHDPNENMIEVCNCGDFPIQPRNS